MDNSQITQTELLQFVSKLKTITKIMSEFTAVESSLLLNEYVSTTITDNVIDPIHNEIIFEEFVKQKQELLKLLK